MRALHLYEGDEAVLGEGIVGFRELGFVEEDEGEGDGQPVVGIAGEGKTVKACHIVDDGDAKGLQFIMDLIMGEDIVGGDQHALDTGNMFAEPLQTVAIEFAGEGQVPRHIVFLIEALIGAGIQEYDDDLFFRGINIAIHIREQRFDAVAMG